MKSLKRIFEKTTALLRQLGVVPLPGNDSKRYAAVYTDSQINSFLCGLKPNPVIDTRETIPGRSRGSEIVVAAVKDRVPLRLDIAFSGARINHWRPFKSIQIENVYLAAADMVFCISLLDASVTHLDGGTIVITATVGVADRQRSRKIAKSPILPTACSAQVKLQIHGTINRKSGTISCISRSVMYLGIKLEPAFDYTQDRDKLSAVDTAFRNMNVLGYTLSA